LGSPTPVLTARISLFMLLPLVSDDGISMEIVALAALAVGLIFVGSENVRLRVSSPDLMEREDRALDEKWTRFLGLGLALLYVGSHATKVIVAVS